MSSTIEINHVKLNIEVDEIVYLNNNKEDQSIEIEYTYSDDQDGRIKLELYYLDGIHSQQFFDENWEELQEKVTKYLLSITN